MKLLHSFRSPAASKNHRITLLDLHRSGMMQVFRKHSVRRLWVPRRETFIRPDSVAP